MINAFKAIARSFYSGHFYGELARVHTGIGVVLISLLTLLITILFSLSFLLGGHYSHLREAISRLPALADTLPAITVKDGTLSIDKPVPYTLTLGSAPDEVHVVVDTNYKITDINALEGYMRQGKVILLVTADKVISRDIQKNEGEQAQIDNTLRISDLRDSRPFTMTHDNWRALGETVKTWGMPMVLAIIFVAMFVGMFIANFIATIFSGVAVMVCDLIAKTGLEFPAALRLAAAFRIPVIVLSFIPVLIGVHPLSGLTCWALWGIYLVFAVWSVRLYDGGKA